MKATLLRILRHDARSWYGEVGDPVVKTGRKAEPPRILRAVRLARERIPHAAPKLP